MEFVWPQVLRKGFLCGWAGKESARNVGDLGLIPGFGRSPGEGKGYPLQYSGLENSMDCIAHGVAKSQTWLSDFHTQQILGKGFPGDASGKEPVCQCRRCRRCGFNPWVGRSREGHGNLLQYSCLENPNGQMSLVACSPWGHKESNTTEVT